MWVKWVLENGVETHWESVSSEGPWIKVEHSGIHVTRTSKMIRLVYNSVGIK